MKNCIYHATNLQPYLNNRIELITICLFLFSIIKSVKKVLLIHGPNLNLLGIREPEKYGHMTSELMVENLKLKFKDIELTYFQSNVEGEIVNNIQQAKEIIDGILINAGGFSHTSVAIADAIRSINLPVIAVHITNIYQREGYRHADIVGESCKGAIVGLGIEGYELAMECLMEEI
ncbi:MAG: type II 3-dehydroquinate dehydratase [Bacteroidetes bacterium]|nr:type II 3-dehydroquinate dehydratase [Bacteroidota bacterium]